MQFRNVTGSPLQVDTDLLVFSVCRNLATDPAFKAANAALKGVLAELAEDEKFVGKTGQSLVVYTNGSLKAKRIALVGAGPRDDLSLPRIRDLAARAAKIGHAKGASSVCFVTPPTAPNDVNYAVQFAVEGALLGSYKFDKYRTTRGQKEKRRRISTFSVSTNPSGKARKASRGVRAAMKRAQAVATAICRARDYVNEPAAALTPKVLAAHARALAKKHAALTVKVLGPKECAKLGMGMFLAVGMGSDQESRFIHMTYKTKGRAKKRVALIGKGVTFDSGGYSLKPSAGMEDMKIDMSGAAAVIASMGAIAELGSTCEVHAVAACCENLVSGRAYKLGDVLKAFDGTTVEINNTDAEGRLTLGDAIGYTRAQIKPDEMFDFATLTGACMVALGPYTAGVMSNNESLAQRWMASADNVGESMWRLPLPSRLREQLKSNIADMRNTGERWGGAITAGLFLKHFARDTPWVHVDLAGPASSSSEFGATTKGGTGFAVSTIVDYLTR